MNYFCITRPKNGRPLFKKDGAIFYACHDQASIVSPEDKFELIIDKNCIQTFISFSKTFVEKILSDLISQPVIQPLIFENVMDSHNPKIKAWWDLIDSIKNFTHNFTNASFFQEMRSDFEYIIVKSLLLSQPNNYSDLIYKNTLDYPDFLNRLLEFIQKNIQQKIEISDLEYASGLSKKKLNTIFKKYLKCSPNAYIRHYRLKCIYNEISQSSYKISITEIAYKWGVTHLGRFSIEYKQAFGEKPSETLKKIIER
jgi:AraC-like DNA-binding protein